MKPYDSGLYTAFLPQGDMPWTVTGFVRSDYSDLAVRAVCRKPLWPWAAWEADVMRFVSEQKKDNLLAVVTNCQGYYQTSGDDVAVWRRAAVVYDGRTLFQYLDGQMVYSTALSGLNSGGAGSIYIGNDQSIAPFKGAIDHVRIYRGALVVSTIFRFYVEASGFL